MKKIILSMLIGVLLSPSVFAEGLAPVAYFQNESGTWTVSGFESGSDYVADSKKKITEAYEERKAEIDSTDASDAEKETLKAQVGQEEAAALGRLTKTGLEIDYVLEALRVGKTLPEAEAAAKGEILAVEANEPKPYQSYDPTDSTTSYNSGSVTDSLLSGNSEAPLVNNSNFKQFNELDCSYDEVAKFIDKSKDKKTKAYSTSPNYSSVFKPTATASATVQKGEEEGSCQTIFHDMNFESMPEFSMSDLPSFSDIQDGLNDLGKKAMEQGKELYNDLMTTMKEGLCARLSSDYVGDLAGDLIEDAYKEETKGTKLEGTKLSGMDKESGQNNFTYKVIKNQTELSDSNLIKAMDVTRDDQSKQQQKFFEKNVDNILDGLEDDIFG